MAKFRKDSKLRRLAKLKQDGVELLCRINKLISNQKESNDDNGKPQ